MINFRVSRDVEKSHGASVSIGRKKGIAFHIQWRSFEPYDNGHDPWMLHFQIFVFGTFLGVTPFSDTYLGRRCASNGVTLFSWTPVKPKWR